MSYWHEERKCKMCGKEFRCYKSGNAQTCGEACRKRWSRRKGHTIKARDNIMQQLATYRRMLKEYPDLKPDMLEQLRFLKTEVNFLLQLGGGDEEAKQRLGMLNDVAAQRDRAGL